MDKKKSYDELTVVKQLSRKHDLQITNRQIRELSGNMAKGDVGIHSRGKIDYLTNYCGYVHFFVPRF